MGAFLSTFGVELGIFPEVVAQSRAPCSSLFPFRHTTGRHFSVYHSSNFRAVPFLFLGSHFQSEPSIWPQGRPARLCARSCALGDLRMKKNKSRACKEGLCAKCVPDGDGKWEIRCPSGPTGHVVFILHLGRCYRPLVTACATLVFVLGQGLHLAAPADF